MLPLFTGAFFDDVEKVEWSRGTRDPSRGHLLTHRMGRGTRWLPCLCGVTSASPEAGSSWGLCCPTTLQLTCLSGGNKRVPNAQAKCAVGIPWGGRGTGGAFGEPEAPWAMCLADAWSRATRGDWASCDLRWRWNASCSGSTPGSRGPAAPAGGDRPPQVADPGPEGRGSRVLQGASSGPSIQKEGGHIARGSLLHTHPFLGQDWPSPLPWGLDAKERFLQPQRAHFSAEASWLLQESPGLFCSHVGRRMGALGLSALGQRLLPQLPSWDRSTRPKTKASRAPSPGCVTQIRGTLPACGERPWPAPHLRSLPGRWPRPHLLLLPWLKTVGSSTPVLPPPPPSPRGEAGPAFWLFPVSVDTAFLPGDS